MDVVLVMDLGATNSRTELHDLQGKTVGEPIVFDTPLHYFKARRSIIQTSKQLVAKVTESATTPTIVACGGGVAGRVDEDGLIMGAGNLPAWVGHNLAEDLSRKLGVPTKLANDAAVAAVAEFSHYRHSLVMLTHGTGVGGGAVQSDKDRFRLHPGEFGHMTIDRSSSLRCGCGGLGHLEALIGGNNLEQRFGVSGEKLTDDQWSEVQMDLATGISSLSTVFPDLPFVIGGGITEKRGGLDRLQRMVNDRTTTCPSPKVLPAHFGGNAGMIGASFLARQLVEQA